VSGVREAVASAGRDPAGFEITAHGARPEDLDTLIAAGVDRMVINLRPLGAGKTIPHLDRVAGALPLPPAP
jgi:hypothetical protein